MTDVETKLDAGGNLQPTAFQVQGRRIPIFSYGRQWEVDDARHYLVMDRDRRVYELVYHNGENRWELGRTPDHPGPPRIHRA